MDTSITMRLGVALALGLVIGMERGWESRDRPKGQRVAGIRSFGFVGLFGGMAALLGTRLGVLILATAFLGVALIVVVSYGISARQSEEFGITTELVMLITFSLGALAGIGLELEALATAVVTAGLLGFKQEIHQTLAHLDRRELMATLQLLILALVALPLLPNQDLGPWNALNPRTIGFLIVLIAGISYVGYFAMRFLGSRIGLLATAALGGLVSSTAVTVSFGRMARQKLASPALLGAGIALAASIMAVRVLLEVMVVNASLLQWLLPPILVLAIVPLLAAIAIALRKDQQTSQVDLGLRNPVELGSAVIFGGILTALFVLVRAFESWFGDTGVYLLAAISGVADVDAVSLSLAQSTLGNLAPTVGATGILIAAMVNTAVKATIATLIGGWPLARWCASILLVSLGLSAIAVWIVF